MYEDCEWQLESKEAIYAYCKYYSSMSVGAQKNKNLNQDSQSPGWELNPRPHRYHTGMLTNQMKLSYS
jgi:hypothetical protein